MMMMMMMIFQYLYFTNLSKQAFTFWFSFLSLLSNWDYRMYSMVLKNFNHFLVFLTRNLQTCRKLWGSKAFPSSPVMLPYPITKVDAGYNSACVSTCYAFWKSFQQGAHCFLAVPPVGLCIFCTLSQQRQGNMTFSINPYRICIKSSLKSHLVPNLFEANWAQEYWTLPLWWPRSWRVSTECTLLVQSLALFSFPTQVDG